MEYDDILFVEGMKDYVMVYLASQRQPLVTHVTMKGMEARRYFKINGEEVIDLGEILVEDAAEVLKAGTVTAMRPLVKMEVDKLTYNVEDDVDSKTSTVLDMLRKVPMVSVDGQDNISVNGSSSFVVYVDGKPNQMMSQNASQIFKMMPFVSRSFIRNLTRMSSDFSLR